MPGILAYLKKSSFYTNDVDSFISKLRKESGEFRESYAKSLHSAVGQFSVMRSPKISQKEVNFAVRLFFDRCIIKNYKTS
jgi:hypothetical protein